MMPLMTGYKMLSVKLQGLSQTGHLKPTENSEVSNVSVQVT